MHSRTSARTELCGLAARRQRRRAPPQLSHAQQQPQEPKQQPLADLQSFFASVQKRIEWELDFNNWAPKSARAWRLREIPPELMQRDADKGKDADSAPVDLSVDLAAALEAVRDAPSSGPLSGLELMQLSLAKFGVAYDMSLKQIDLMKGGTDRFVNLNLYVGQLHQRSFPMTREQYLSKLDSIADALNAWNQSDYIRDWFKQAPAPRAGLPSRPRVDTAVGIRLNSSPTWDPQLAETWFDS